jgi:hypothetical protein
MTDHPVWMMLIYIVGAVVLAALVYWINRWIGSDQ